MTFRLALLLLLFALPVQAAEYTNPQQIYSFTYPDDWQKQMQGTMVLVTPNTGDDTAVCFSRAESTPPAKDDDIVKLMDVVVEKDIFAKAIQAADKNITNLQKEKITLGNTIAQRLVYDSVKDGRATKNAALFTYSTVSGHTIDITCLAYAENWPAYTQAIDAMQKSLAIAANPLPFAIKDGPDLVRDKPEVVTKYIEMLRPNISKLRLPDGSFVSPETPQELAQPILPLEDARRTVSRGILSGMAMHCGLDWQNASFTPFMAQERARSKWSEKQLAFMGALHGIAQQNTAQGALQLGPCDADFQAKTQQILQGLQ
ncbi:MAG: hypothetical protein GC136_09570 [Alphaproteobacteria bacterium]|nr:hypothetical protein [Alphaproteobacteria bacterium]